MADLRNLLDAQPILTDTHVFGEGNLACTVELRQLDKREAEAVGRAARKQVNGRIEVDQPRFRKALRDAVIVGWDDLTVGKVFAYCQRPVPAGLNADDAVPFSPDTALLLLERARTTMSDVTVDFEAWVLERASEATARRVAEDAAAGKD